MFQIILFTREEISTDWADILFHRNTIKEMRNPMDMHYDDDSDNPQLASHYDAVLIDLDGTLIDTKEAIYSSIQYAISATGLSEYTNIINLLSENVLKKGHSLGDAAKEVLSSLGLEDKASPEEIVSLYREHYINHANILAQPFPGALEAVQQLFQQGVKLAIVTNKGRQASIKNLQHHGLLSYFDIIVADQPGVLPKPHPQSFHNLLVPALDLDSTSSILMIGDTPTDIAYAHAIGAKSCWVTYGFGDPSSTLAHKPDFTVDTAAQWADLASVPS